MCERVIFAHRFQESVETRNPLVQRLCGPDGKFTHALGGNASTIQAYPARVVRRRCKLGQRVVELHALWLYGWRSGAFCQFSQGTLGQARRHVDVRCNHRATASYGGSLFHEAPPTAARVPLVWLAFMRLAT